MTLMCWGVKRSGERAWQMSITPYCTVCTERNDPWLMYWLVRFRVLTAAVTNVAILWDIAPCDPYANRRFGW
jgi:hypothetical protein